MSKREELGQIVIRPPQGMRDQIKAAAEANNRSMNQEIVARLQATFRMNRTFIESDEDLEQVKEHFLAIKELHRIERLEQEMAELKKKLRTPD